MGVAEMEHSKYVIINYLEHALIGRRAELVGASGEPGWVWGGIV